jgi:hypothetical protein
LDLQVVVHSNWREDSEALRELGYENWGYSGETAAGKQGRFPPARFLS